LYAFLKAEGRVANNPAEAMTYAPEREWLPPVPPPPNVFIRLIEQPDTSTALGYRDRTMMEVLYAAGLRVSELLSLRVDDVYLEEEKIKVVGKGRGKPERYVPILNTAARYLTTYLHVVREDFLDGREGSATVFLSTRGTAMSKPAFRARLKRYAEQAGIETRIYPHLFRHGTLTHCLEGGADIRQLQALAGHKRLNQTAGYTHVSITSLKAVLRRCHPREIEYESD
jgi:integrase/recombinase XerD